MPSTKHLLILLIISAIIFTGFGYLVLPKVINQSVIEKKQAATQPQNNTFAAGLDAAYNRLIARGHADVAVPGYGYRESKTIAGKIKEIKDNQIILDVYPINPLADPQLDQRKVILDKNTKLYQRVEKTPEQMQKDFAEFDIKMKAEAEKMNNRKEGEIIQTIMPPEPFGQKEIDLSQFKAGDQIMITADNNIHNLKEFTAKEITLE